MSELHSGVRRGRAQPNSIVQAEKPIAGRRRRAVRDKQQAAGGDENVVTRSAKRKEEIRFLEGEGEIGERRMDEFDSGARSPDKLPAGEDEGSTAPVPEKATISSLNKKFL